MAAARRVLAGGQQHGCAVESSWVLAGHSWAQPGDEPIIVTDATARVAGILRPPPDLLPWQWAAEHVDFGRVPNYEAEAKGAYDPDFMPYWREPVEAMCDRTTSEVWVRKASRMGASENLLLNAMRYAVACRPQPTLYVSGDQKKGEEFFRRRLKLGFQLSAPTAQAFREATDTEHLIMFPTMDLTLGWAKGKGTFKQSGYQLILADEVSTWPTHAVDMLRERTANYSFSTIIGISSPDPAQTRDSDDDPIFRVYEQGDQRRWHMPDPGGGDPFEFRMGTRDGWGLHWDQSAKRPDGTWDLAKVAASAHYITPSGARIDEADRMRIVRQGDWLPTAVGSPGVRSYHADRFLCPFKVGSFGAIARAFLAAQQAGPSFLRIWTYEYMAERWYSEKEEAPEQEIDQRRADYCKGSLYSQVTGATGQHRVIIGGDVQKHHEYLIAREFDDYGNSALIEWRPTAGFAEFKAAADRYGLRYGWQCMIDCNYKGRALETLEACLHYRFGAIRGNDNLAEPWRKHVVDVYEGSRRQGGGSLVTVFTFRPTPVKDYLMDMIRGLSRTEWRLPKDVGLDYLRQILAEQKIDGQYIARGANHYLDCEVYALFAAIFARLYRPLNLAVDVSE